MQAIRVFIADDHPVYRKGLKRRFDEDPELEVVGMAADGQQALSGLLKLRPDVALLDISMPEKNGVQVLKELRDHDVGPKDMAVIFLTGTNQEEMIYSAVAQGANAYILKTADWSYLRFAIKAVYGGETIIAPEVMNTLSRQIAGHATLEEMPRLTPRELEILELIADGFSHEEIGDRLSVEPSTVKTHLNHVYKKLNVKTAVAAVAEALRQRLIQ